MMPVSAYKAFQEVPINNGNSADLKRLDRYLAELSKKNRNQWASQYEWYLGAVSHDRLSLYMSYLLAFPFIRDNFNVSTEVSKYEWIQSPTGELKRVQDVSRRTYLWNLSNIVTFQETTKEGMGLYFLDRPSLKLLSVTGSSEVHFGETAKDFLERLQEEVISTIRLLEPQALNYLEWRYERLNFCDHAPSLMNDLGQKGFKVYVQEPYIVIQYGNVFPCQAIGVQLLNKNLAEDFALEEEKKLSLYSFRQAQIKENLQDTITRLNQDLQLIAFSDPLIKRYAFDISPLDENFYNRLCEEIEALGYSVLVDIPFIYREKGSATLQFKQYLLIQLP